MNGTLSEEPVQEVAKQFVDEGFEVWIVTTRLCDEKAPSERWNEDLYKVAITCKIPHSQIHFTNGNDKWEWLKDKDFIFHLDDDLIENNMINAFTDCKAIDNFGNPKWKEQCLEFLI